MHTVARQHMKLLCNIVYDIYCHGNYSSEINRIPIFHYTLHDDKVKLYIYRDKYPIVIISPYLMMMS